MKLHSSAFALSLTLICSAPLAAQDMPKPGPEHQKLAQGAGSWDCVVEAMGMDGKPSKSKATAEMKMLPGGFWLVEEFTGDYMGQPFQGHGVFGYDTGKSKYVGSWVDSMAPSLLIMEGTCDKDGKVMTMTGQGPGMDGKMTTLRMVSTWKDDNTKVFQMFAPGPDGKDVCGVTITYTRRTAKAGGAASPPAKK